MISQDKPGASCSVGVRAPRSHGRFSRGTLANPGGSIPAVAYRGQQSAAAALAGGSAELPGAGAAAAPPGSHSMSQPPRREVPPSPLSAMQTQPVGRGLRALLRGPWEALEAAVCLGNEPKSRHFTALGIKWGRRGRNLPLALVHGPWAGDRSQAPPATVLLKGRRPL